MKTRENSGFEEIIGHHFSRPELLQQALTHTSHAREAETTVAPNQRVSDNEQLEFLGDAVLSLVTTEELFHRFPHFHEGELSKLRAHLVSEKHLVRSAQKIGLGKFLRLGRGEEKSGGRQKTTILADALEAVLAAVYLDSGFDAARKIILMHIVTPELEILQEGPGVRLNDFKSSLQETLQASGRSQLSYDLVEEHGPDHNKTFIVEARLRARPGNAIEFVGRAEGPTKKSAEQDAARQVLEYLATQQNAPQQNQEVSSPQARGRG
jgi:ribonuclease-3